MNDQDFLRRAVEVGNRQPAPYNFGAVVVKNGEIIGESQGRVEELADPSAHSEVMALREAAKHVGEWQIGDATLYCSHEPCAMCFSCALWAGITRVVYVIPKEDQHDFMYEFEGIGVHQLAGHSVRKNIKVEHIPLEAIHD